MRVGTNPISLGPYTKRKFEQARDSRGLHTQKKDHVGTQQEGSHLQAKERGLRRNQTFQNLDLGHPTTRTMRK